MDTEAESEMNRNAFNAVLFANKFYPFFFQKKKFFKFV